MREGAREEGSASDSYFARITPLRYLALGVGVAGFAVLEGLDETTGVYVIAIGLLLASLDDWLSGDRPMSAAIAALAFLLVSDQEQVPILFVLSVAVVLLAGALVLYREFRRHR